MNPAELPSVVCGSRCSSTLFLWKGVGSVRLATHGTRFERYMDVSMHNLQFWLPDNTVECHVRGLEWQLS